MIESLQQVALQVNTARSDIVATLGIMTDDRIRKRQGDRLGKARALAGWRSARAAALENGWAESTYRAHENGTRTIGQDDAEVYARRFRSAGVDVTAQGILFGDEEAHTEVEANTTIGVFGYIGAGGSIDTSSAQIDDHEPLFQVRVPFPIPEDALAFQIRGESMWPKYDPGDVIVCSRFAENPDGVIGHTAAVETAEGSRYLKRVLKGSKPGHFLLLSHNAPEMVDIPVVSFSSVIAVIPASQVHEATNQVRRAVIRQIKSGKALRG